MFVVVFIVFCSYDRRLTHFAHIQEIRDEFLNKATEDEILSALEGLCKKLGPVEGICDEAVKSYVPKYFIMARNFLTNPKVL